MEEELGHATAGVVAPASSDPVPEQDPSGPAPGLLLQALDRLPDPVWVLRARRRDPAAVIGLGVEYANAAARAARSLGLEREDAICNELGPATVPGVAYRRCLEALGFAPAGRAHEEAGAGSFSATPLGQDLVVLVERRPQAAGPEPEGAGPEPEGAGPGPKAERAGPRPKGAGPAPQAAEGGPEGSEEGVPGVAEPSTWATAMPGHPPEPVAPLVAAREPGPADEVQRLRAVLQDPLTGLANRAVLFDRVEHALARSRRSADPSRAVAVVGIGIDGFRELSELLGRTGGEAVLKTVAARLVGSVRQEDTVARLGGDEMMVLCDDIDAVGLAKLRARVVESVTQPLSWRHEGTSRFMPLSASVAVVMAQPDDGVDTLVQRVQDLLVQSDRQHRRVASGR